MDGLQLRDEAVRDRIRLAEEFLDPSDPRARSYRADIILMLNRGLRRLTVNLDEIRSHNKEIADRYTLQRQRFVIYGADTRQSTPISFRLFPGFR